jgi:trimeric autotransporter adhesin
MFAAIRMMGVRTRRRGCRRCRVDRRLISIVVRAVGAAVVAAGLPACSSTLDSNRAPVATVNIDPTSTTLSVGSSLAFRATVMDPDGRALTDREVFWASNDTTVATVSATGVVTAVRLGSAMIAASSEGKYAIATVAVAPVPVATVTVLPGSVELTVGDTTRLRAVTYDAQGQELTGRQILWTTSNSSVASVDASGLVTAVGEGSATISATSEGKTGTSQVTVRPAPVASVTVDPPSLTLNPGLSAGLTATPRDAHGNPLSGRAVTWTTDNSAVATVSADGTVTAVGLGTATITATCEGHSGTATVQVVPAPVARVDVSPSSVELGLLQSVLLTARTYDARGNELTGRPISWSSSDSTTAYVDQTGRVWGLLPGTAIISATSEGVSGTSTVTVRP